MKKRFFAGLLAFMMMLSVIPAAEVSATTVSGDNLQTLSSPNLDEPAPQIVQVSTYEALVTAVESGAAHVQMTNDITATATESSGYGKAGVVLLEEGDILDGAGHKLTIQGADTTWDCAIAMKGGEVRNLTISGAFRGVFMPGAVADVVIDNCILKDVTYTFNSDAGSKDYSVTIKNTTLAGWTSFSNVHKSVTFENCTFEEGRGYAFCRPYQATTFINCKFADGFEVDTSQVAANGLVFNGCTYNGVALSADNNDLFAGGSVVIDGSNTDVNHYAAKIGDTKFKTLKDALAAGTGTITLLDTVNVEETIVVDGGKTVVFDLNNQTLSGSVDPLFKVTNGTLELTGSGSILAKNDAIRLHGNEAKGGSAKTARVIVGKDVAVMSDNSNCIYMRGYGAVADVYGYLATSSTKYAAIQGNGTVTDSLDYGRTELNIYSSASVINENNMAIYHPQSGKVTVMPSDEYAASIIGTTGIEMRAGELVVKGGHIASTGAFKAESNENGSTVTGAAIAVSQHSTDLPTKVVIEGGLIEAENSNGKAFYEADLQNLNPYDVEVEIKGGDFVGAVEFADLANKKVISGGWFDREVTDAYVANGSNKFQVTAEDTGKVWYGVCNHAGTVELLQGYEASCIYDGMKASYGCCNCGLLFEDQACTKMVTEESLVIAKIPHKFINGVCDYGCGTKNITVEESEVKVTVEAAESQVVVSPSIKNEEEKAAAAFVADSIQADPDAMVDSLLSVGEACAKDEKLIEQAKEKLNDAKEENIEIVVKPYLETTVTAVNTEAKDDQAVVSLDMKLLYDVEAVDKESGDTYTLKEGVKAEKAEPMLIAFVLPADVIDAKALKDAGKVLYIEHPKADGSVYYHEATIEENVDYFTDENDVVVYFDAIYFYNDKGFSEFTLMVGKEVPADKVVSTSAPAPAATIAMFAATGEYIATESVDEATIAEGKAFLKSLIGDSRHKYELAVAVDLNAKLDRATKIKILVDGVTADDAVIILHKGEDGWEVVPSDVYKDYVVGKFTDLSPVLVYVDNDGAKEAAQAAVATPAAGTAKPAPTGDSANIAGLSLTMIACAAAIVLFARRRVNK